MNVRPDDRLTSAAAFVRQGACFADIGTDHAILPVFLYKSQKISRAYACDIAHGPCEKARAQVRAAGLCNSIEVVQTDGLSGLDQKGITDIAICGMGGELIASIVDAAPWVKEGGVRLILQPMTKAPQLRAYLAEAGFSVLKETVTEVSGKLYTCLCAEYTNTPHPLSVFEAEIGEYHISHPSPMGKKWAESRLKAMEKRLKALRDERDLALEAQIRRYIYDCENDV